MDKVFVSDVPFWVETLVSMRFPVVHECGLPWRASLSYQTFNSLRQASVIKDEKEVSREREIERGNVGEDH